MPNVDIRAVTTFVVDLSNCRDRPYESCRACDVSWTSTLLHIAIQIDRDDVLEITIFFGLFTHSSHLGSLSVCVI
jgi:hypothetical protein